MVATNLCIETRNRVKPMERARVLVVEDDSAISDVVCRRLTKMGLAAEAAFSGTEARRLLEDVRFDVVITDLMLPGATGEEVVRTVRELEGYTPVIVMSARATTADKVDLLSLGADDYLTKPFDLDELAARVEVQLRRAGQPHSPAVSSADGDEAPIVAGAWTIDRAERSLMANGTEVPLTRTEYDIAEILARNPKRVFTKQELYERIWNEGYLGQENSVSTHVSNLRAKLKPTGTDSYIQTVWGIGFKLNAE